MNALARRIIGAFLGGGMGLLYSLVAQTINLIALPGIPLYSPTPGRVISILFAILYGAGLGLIAAWPASMILGVGLSGFAGAVGVVIGTLTNTIGSHSLVASLAFNLLYIFIPMIVLFMPVGLLIRWAINTITVRYGDNDVPSWKQWAVPVGVLIVAGIIGSFSLYSAEEREGITQINRMIQSSVSAESAALPEPLKTVEGFRENASPVYTLESTDARDLYQGPVPESSNALNRVTIVVRFKNGFTFACITGRGIVQPLCRNL